MKDQREKSCLQPFTLDSVIAHGDDAVAANVGHEVVVLNVDRGFCYSLNKTASRIWHLLAEPTSVSDICAKLVAAFDIDPARCEQEVLSLLGRWEAEGLIKSIASASPSSADD